jgi:hypothetical protein
MHVISILVTAVAFGVVLHTVPSYAKTSPAVEDDSIAPSASTFRKRHSSTSAAACWRHDGPTARLSLINLRA